MCIASCTGHSGQGIHCCQVLYVQAYLVCREVPDVAHLSVMAMGFIIASCAKLQQAALDMHNTGVGEMMCNSLSSLMLMSPMELNIMRLGSGRCVPAGCYGPLVPHCSLRCGPGPPSYQGVLRNSIIKGALGATLRHDFYYMVIAPTIVQKQSWQRI